MRYFEFSSKDIDVLVSSLEGRKVCLIEKIEATKGCSKQQLCVDDLIKELAIVCELVTTFKGEVNGS